MKKLMIMALGMGLALGTVSFAQDKMDDSKKTEKKAKKTKKTKKTDTKTDDSKKM